MTPLTDWIDATVSRMIDRPPEHVYAVLTDYRVGHPAILPRSFFSDLIVEQGGIGAGTVLRCSIRVFRREFPFRQRVSEPEPGRVLLETDVDTGQLTRWTLEPHARGQHTLVILYSAFPPLPGIMGLLDRLSKPAIIRSIYTRELQQLHDYLHSMRPDQTHQIQP